MYRYHLQPKILSKERINLLIDDPQLEPTPLYTLKIHPSRRTFFLPHSLLTTFFQHTYYASVRFLSRISTFKLLSVIQIHGTAVPFFLSPIRFQILLRVRSNEDLYNINNSLEVRYVISIVRLSPSSSLSLSLSLSLCFN